MLFAESMSSLMNTVPELVHTYSPSHFSLSLPTKESKASNRKSSIDVTERSRFLELPLEIRYKIYSYLLPPQTYTIIPSISYNAASFHSLFPLRHSNTPPYRILPQTNNNHESSHPQQLCLSILLTSHQVHHEAISILYGSPGTSFSFGTSTYLIKPFFSKMSALARSSVHSISFAKEVFLTNDSEYDQEWHLFGPSLATLLPAVTNIKITLWSSNGSGKCFPVSIDEMNAISSLDRTGLCHAKWQMWERWRLRELKSDVRRRWLEYSQLEGLFKLKEVREVDITWWDFDPEEERKESQAVDDGQGVLSGPNAVGAATGEQQAQKKIDRMGTSSVLAGSMVIDKVLRRKVICEGGAREGRFVVRL